jgi:hypothetical protein
MDASDFAHLSKCNFQHGLVRALAEAATIHLLTLLEVAASYCDRAALVRILDPNGERS